ncbi:MAG: M28 family peptidase [Paludibacteraceae bacterium]|nr:M28 family peptidase [Paludibacteraceae bacterium]
MKKFLLWMLFPLLTACAAKPAGTVTENRPAFSGDTAYLFVKHQVSLGSRVPGTKAHQLCMLFLVNSLKNCGAEVEIQQGTKLNYAGEEQTIYNIIGRFGDIHQKNRLLLCAHYDSRPWCDEEENYEDRFTALPGANDGASGVGVLLEVARQLSRRDSLPQRAVDIVFFDCEDMGTPSFYTGAEREDTWCLGAQLFAERMVGFGLHKDYQYGVLLDMVGAPDAVFPKEYFSLQYAGNYVEKVWRTADKLGYGRYFKQEHSYPITDDHYYLNTMAGIPCIDIIHYDMRQETGFPYWWHTRQDDMQHIDPATLQAVGEVILSLVDS